jgi:hypothetical protein
MTPKTIAVDFDGVIHSYVSGWLGISPTDPPVDDAREGIAALRAMGFAVHVFTCRALTHAGRKATQLWLDIHDIRVDKVTAIKPHAIVYIDDRGYRFNGSWLDAVNFVSSKEARPWNAGQAPPARSWVAEHAPTCAQCGGHVFEVDDRGHYIECGHPGPEAAEVAR